MLVDTRGLVLHATKYSDTSLIVKIFTEQRGTQSFIIKGAFGKKSKVKSSLFSPLSVLHLTYLEHSERGLNFLKDVSRMDASAFLQFDPARSSILLFYNELLYKLLYDAGPDEVLFRFVLQELEMANGEQVVLNELPLRFLLRLSSVLGIRPEDNYSATNCFFSIEESRFRACRLDEALDLSAEDSRFLHALLTEGEAFEMGRGERNRLLHHLVQYFIKHNEQIHQIESVEILASVLH